jgi:hypothetical protein
LNGDNGGVARLASDQPGATMSTPFQISLAPDQLWQLINPMTFSQQGGQFGYINIDLGGAGDSGLERKILKRSAATVGSSAASAMRWRSF